MKSIYGKLSGMMFLQYAVWGFWMPVLGRYLQASTEAGGLGFTPSQVGWILGLAASIGAVSAPFVGQIADRYFSSERCLAVMLLIGGIVKMTTAYMTTFPAWLILSVIYSILYTPTIALTNSLAFSHLKDPNKEFPYIRVWGTFGWIAASWIFPLVWLLESVKLHHLPPFYTGTEVAHVTGRLVDAMIFSGITSIGYAAFCLLLPHTPPKKNATEKVALAKAIKLFQKPSFLWLVVASVPISIIHNIYFVQTGPFLSSDGGVKDSLMGPLMTVGQFTEIGVMALLGFLLAKLGFRWVIVIGCLGYFMRFAIFGMVGMPLNEPDKIGLNDGTVIAGKIIEQNPEYTVVKMDDHAVRIPKAEIKEETKHARSLSLLILSIAFHGFCFTCYFAAAFIYVDRIAEPDIRHSAQGLFGIIILGLGPVLSTPAIKFLAMAFNSPLNDLAGKPILNDTGVALTVINYSSFWFFIAFVGLASSILMLICFRDQTKNLATGLSEDVATEASEVA